MLHCKTEEITVIANFIQNCTTLERPASDRALLKKPKDKVDKITYILQKFKAEFYPQNVFTCFYVS
jgi:hypothetical protein